MLKWNVVFVDILWPIRCFCREDCIRVAVISLGNPSKDHQRFADAIVLISSPDWSQTISNFEIVVEILFEFGLRSREC